MNEKFKMTVELHFDDEQEFDKVCNALFTKGYNLSRAKLDILRYDVYKDYNWREENDQDWMKYLTSGNTKFQSMNGRNVYK